jgi:sterol 3beta-glucosyltransferase
MINDNEHHQSTQRQAGESASTPTILGLAGAQDPASSSPRIEENVRATLSPLPAPYVARTSMSVDSRSSLDVARKSLDVRRSMDAGRTLRRPSHEIRRSFSGSRYDKQSGRGPGDRSPLSPLSGEPKAQDTSDSATNSLGPGTESSAAIQSMDDSNASASQILGRSDVFRAPTIHAPGVAASDRSDSLARHSQDTTRSSSVRKTNLKSPHPSNRNADSAGNRHASLGSPDADDVDGQQMSSRLSGSSFTSYPLQKASGLAGFLRTRSKKMGNLLATESMGYYEKVSGMLAGGRKHYNVAEGLQATDQVQGFEEDEDAAKAAENFREHFAFPESEQLQSSFFASLQRILPNYGKIYISGRFFCFRSLVPTVKTKVCDLSMDNLYLAYHIRSSYRCAISKT